MESGAKDIHAKNVEKWFQNIDTYSPDEIKETYRFFAKTFIEFLLYVPFNEFYEIIHAISIEFTKVLAEQHEYANIYFLIPDNIHKSNLWVALLFVQCLYKSKTITPEIARKIKFTNNYTTLVSDSTGNKSICLYCDDMSYTGNQIKSHFVRRKTASLPPSDDHIDKYFIISHLSTVARTKLSLIPNVHFFKSTVVVDSYVNRLKQKYGKHRTEMVNNVLKMFDSKTSDQYFKMGRKACHCNSEYTPIYFDHKIADELSTFHKLLFTGAYPIKDAHCEITPLIHGCSDIDELQRLFKTPCIHDSTLDSEVPCFPSFYKTISYTIRGDVVNTNENIIDALYAVEYTPQPKNSKSKNSKSKNSKSKNSKSKNSKSKNRKSKNSKSKNRKSKNSKSKNTVKYSGERSSQEYEETPEAKPSEFTPLDI